jgi:deazaflavin-dependent oxidoreductase (nitroreductase family)
MATADFKKALTATRELEVTVIGRKSNRPISLPVWFVHEGDVLYLLPVKGSDSSWYKNILRSPSMTLAAKATVISLNVRPITEPDKVSAIVEKFRAKYGAADVQKYYSKFDVAIAVGLD